MGYAFCIGSCYTCGKQFNFNPVRVPSIRDGNGIKQPVCKDCIDSANPKRVVMGLPLLTYSEDAYSYCNEEELE